MLDGLLAPASLGGGGVKLGFSGVAVGVAAVGVESEANEVESGANEDMRRTAMDPMREAALPAVLKAQDPQVLPSFPAAAAASVDASSPWPEAS